MSTILGVANVLVPVLLCVLIGFGLARIKAPFDHKMVGSLVANVGYPALILSHLESAPVTLNAFLVTAAAAVAMIACFAILGFLFLKLMGLPVRAFLSPMIFNNVGNIGLPICALAFGEQGLAYALAFLIIVIVGIFTVGIWVPSGKVGLRDIVNKPVVYAVIIALVLMGFDLRLPVAIDHMLHILGGLAIPLMLLTLGHTLATLKTGNLWRGAYLAVFHLAMAVAVAFGLTGLFGFEGVERGVVIIMCLMPAAVATYLWVEVYTPDEAPAAAGFIMISTLLAVVSLPLALAFWV